ncbi:MAG: ParB N-terminal domain-containing protein [Thermoleophilaceae bacterium]|nr:ParB N-terminal domain-containing protein [Thermoleophilaceae bacterium]
MLDTAARLQTDDVIVEVVPVDLLFIDHSFQRPLNQKRVERIASTFDPNLLGVLHVNARDDGRLSVFDGQHRLAALHLLGRTEVACLVHDLTPEEEACKFIDANQFRTAVKPTEIHIAGVRGGRHEAVEIDTIVRRHGFYIADSAVSGALSCAAAVNETHRRGPNVLGETLWVVKEAWGIDDRAARKGPIIGGLGLFIHTYRDVVALDELARKLGLEPAAKILRRATSISDFGQSGSGSKRTYVARAIVDQYNSGRRTRKLSVRRIGRGDEGE